jgi:hypothetical protein
VGPRDVLDTVMKRKIPSPRRESKPRTPIVQVQEKSRSMRWAGHVARRRQTRNAYSILNGKESDNSEDLGVDGKIILECILVTRVGSCGLDLSGSG